MLPKPVTQDTNFICTHILLTQEKVFSTEEMTLYEEQTETQLQRWNVPESLWHVFAVLTTFFITVINISL
jgi:hypothetical protein